MDQFSQIQFWFDEIRIPGMEGHPRTADDTFSAANFGTGPETGLRSL